MEAWAGSHREEGATAERPGPTRPGHGVVIVYADSSNMWAAEWLDLGVVEVTGERQSVLTWARAQPAAEHLLSVPSSGSATPEELPLDSEQAQAYFAG